MSNSIVEAAALPPLVTLLGNSSAEAAGRAAGVLRHVAANSDARKLEIKKLYAASSSPSLAKEAAEILGFLGH